jgi:hypothetical protein
MFREKIKLFAGYLLISVLMLTYFNCGDKGVATPPPTGVKIMVKSSIDTSLVNGANVVLYNANSGEALMRAESGSDGIAEFTNLTEGSYYARIAAQGYKELPIGNVSPIPFQILKYEVSQQTFYMDTLQGTFGTIDGYVDPAQAGFLVVASSAVNGDLHSYSGPDGYFAIFNVPFNTYSVYAVKSGFNATDTALVNLTSGAPDANVQLAMSQTSGSTLTGMVTFLAVENGTVDVSLLDKNALSVVSGLTTTINTDRNYTLNNIPNGEYTAWASYKNDGYVMDPDWIFKNPGALDVSIYSQSTLQLDFSVTGAISIVSPTNPDDEIIPALADSNDPLFVWNPYPQAKEYIIEVKDMNGNIVWGGFDENGIIRHAQIPRTYSSIRFNFDGSAAAELQSGQVYQWKIYADDDILPNVQTLLSSSEDLKGLFITP